MSDECESYENEVDLRFIKKTTVVEQKNKRAELKIKRRNSQQITIYNVHGTPPSSTFRSRPRLTSQQYSIIPGLSNLKGWSQMKLKLPMMKSSERHLLKWRLAALSKRDDQLSLCSLSESKGNSSHKKGADLGRSSGFSSK